MSGASTLVVLSRLQQLPPSLAVERVRRAGSWVDAALPETRLLHESLRLHEVGLEVRYQLPCCAAACGAVRLQAH